MDYEEVTKYILDECKDMDFEELDYEFIAAEIKKAKKEAAV